MNKISTFHNLEPKARALVAIGVLLDGFDASFYLEDDLANGAELKSAAESLAGEPIEQRQPFVGTLLRAALAELKRGE